MPRKVKLPDKNSLAYINLRKHLAGKLGFLVYKDASEDSESNQQLADDVLSLLERESKTIYFEVKHPRASYIAEKIFTPILLAMILITLPLWWLPAQLYLHVQNRKKAQ